MPEAVELRLTIPPELGPEAEVLEARRSEAVKRPLFQDRDPLPFTLTADFKAINRDRNPESANVYPGLLVATDARGREQTLHVKLSPRGHFRRMARNCEFVPPARPIMGASTCHATRNATGK